MNPKGFGALLASMYDAGAKGLIDQESNEFQQLVNDQPRPCNHFTRKYLILKERYSVNIISIILIIICGIRIFYIMYLETVLQLPERPHQDI